MAKNEVRVIITGDAQGLKGALDKAEGQLSEFSRKMQDTGQRMMTAGAGLTASVTLPVVAMFKTSLDAFVEAEKSQAQLEASFASTGAAAWTNVDAMNALAQSMQDKLAVDADTVSAGQSILLTFTEVQNRLGEGNDIFDQATMMAADLSAKLGMDLPSANMLLGKALNDPIAGMTALRRSGVQLTDAQEEQVKAFMESGDILSAQKVILGELETQFAGSAEAAAGTTGGKMEALRVKFEDLQESIGERLIPIIGTLGDWLQRGLEYWDSLGERGQTIALIMAGVAAAIGPVVFVVGSLVTAIGFLISPVGLVIAAIAGLVAAFVYFYKTNEGFREWVDGVVTAVREGLVNAFNWFVDNVVPKLVDAFNFIKDEVFPRIVEAVQTLVDAHVRLWEWIQQAWDWITEKAGQAADWFNTHVAPTLSAALDFIITANTRFLEVVRTVWSAIQPVVSVAMDVIRSYIEVGVGFIRAVWDGAFQAMRTIVSTAWDAIRGIIEGALQVIRGIFQFFTGILTGDWRGALDGLRNIAIGAWTAITSVISGAIGVIRGIVSGIGAFFSSVWNGPLQGLRDAVSIGFNAIVDFIRSVPGRIVGALSGLASAISSPFTSAFSSIRSFWNSTVGGFSFTIPEWVPGVGGRGFSIPNMFTGGVVRQGGLAMVGELGPEVVQLPTGSKVYPNGFGPPGMFASGANITVNVTAGVGDPAEIGRVVVDTIKAYEQRNGVTWRAA